MFTRSNKICADCGAVFLANRTTHRFCHVNCRIRANRKLHKQTPEVEQAKTSIFEFYKQQISQLSDQEILRAVATLLTESPEDRSNRKQSMLYKLLNKESQHV